MDHAQIRSDHPGLEEVTYLDTSSCGLPANSTVEAARIEQELLMRHGSGRFAYWMEEGTARIGDLVATDLGVHGSDVALIAGWSAGIAQLANSMHQHPRVLLLAEDYPTLHAPFQEQGFVPTLVPLGPDGTPSLDILAAAMEREKPHLVAISHVQWKTGHRVDLASVTELCRAHNAWSVVDVTQSWGSVPLDLAALGVDIAGGSAYKWPLAGFGNGFMYAAQHVREALKAASQMDPFAQLSKGHRDPVALVRLGHALERMVRAGLPAIADRTSTLCDHAIARFDAVGIAVLHGREPKHRAGILMIEGDAKTVELLTAAKVQVAQRGAGIRLGVHYYNNEQDIERLVEAIVG